MLLLVIFGKTFSFFYIDFNTTYVTVSHGEMYVVDNAIENFNTTYVTVSRIRERTYYFADFISIQLMLLLVVVVHWIDRNSHAFQYNLCYC